MNCMVYRGGNYAHSQIHSNKKETINLSVDSVLQRPLIRLISLIINIFNSFIYINKISLISNVNKEAKFRSTFVKYQL